MRRRDFLKSVAATAVWPRTASAQARIPRVGYLGPEPADSDSEHFSAFREGLRDLGYVEGESVAIEARWPARGVESLPELANELVALKVDVIVTGGPGVFAARKATATIPIVVGVFSDLVKFGFADSFSHPGHNVTGHSFLLPEMIVKRVELLKRCKPSMTKLGLFVLSHSPSTPTYVRALEGVARSMGFSISLIEVADVEECERALTTGSAASVEGVVLTDFPMFVHGAAPPALAALATHRVMPSAGPLTFARSGGLLAYGVDFPSMFRSAGHFVDKILKGANPGDLPIEQNTRFTTIFNLRTAAALGIEMPADLLAAADEVIE